MTDEALKQRVRELEEAIRRLFDVGDRVDDIDTWIAEHDAAIDNLWEVLGDDTEA